MLPYGITKGPDGSFYITDAAANTLLYRSRTGVYCVVAEVPGIPNSTPVGPPMVESAGWFGQTEQLQRH